MQKGVPLFFFFFFEFRAAVRYRPLFNSNGRHVDARHPVPRAAVRAQPLQHLEMPALCRVFARPPVPLAPFCARPLQRLEVPAPRCLLARPLIPRAAVRARPLQYLEVPFKRRDRARFRVPRAFVCTRPLKHLEVPAVRRTRARPLVPRAAVRETPSTSRDFHSSPLSHKGILDATGNLPVAGAAPRLNIQGAWRDIHQALQTQAPFPPPCRASRGSPLGAVRDLRGRRNAQF
jgi:hypothetical protein